MTPFQPKTVGFLTYDLQPFTEDCLNRVADAIRPIQLKAYPVIFHPNQANVRLPFYPSRQRGRYMGITVDGNTPEGFAWNINWRAAWRCVRDSDVVVLFGLQGGTALLSAALATIFRRTVVSVNQTLPIEWELKRRWWVRWLKRWLLSRCSLHIWQTEVTPLVLEHVYRIDRERMIHAPFEAGATLFRSLLREAATAAKKVRLELGIADQTVFLFVGNLHPFKGVPQMIEASARMPTKARFVCVFAGPEEPANATGGTVEYYMRLARGLGIESRVRFTGKLAPQLLAELYLASDVVVLPTHKDCFPKVLVEGALAGKPLITTSANGAAGSIVIDGDNGFVVEPGDIDGLARAMEKLLNSQIRTMMGVRSRELVDALCDPSAETAGYCRAIQCAMENQFGGHA